MRASPRGRPQRRLLLARPPRGILPVFPSCVHAPRSSGIGAVELFSMSLKATGAYLARTLSYAGAEFDLHRMQMAPVHK